MSNKKNNTQDFFYIHIGLVYELNDYSINSYIDEKFSVRAGLSGTGSGKGTFVIQVNLLIFYGITKSAERILSLCFIN